MVHAATHAIARTLTSFQHYGILDKAPSPPTTVTVSAPHAALCPNNPGSPDLTVSTTVYNGAAIILSLHLCAADPETMAGYVTRALESSLAHQWRIGRLTFSDGLRSSIAYELQTRIRHHLDNQPHPTLVAPCGGIEPTQMSFTVSTALE
jgi:hypothetical protein